MNYITHKRFEAVGIDGGFNIPYGTELDYVDGLLYYRGRCVCRAESENGYEHFHEASKHGELRYAMISELKKYYLKHDEEVPGDIYYREFAPQENDYWLHILRTMETPRLMQLCEARLGGVPH